MYSAAEPGGGNVFLNWGSYWAVMQGSGLVKSSFPFDVAQERDKRLAVVTCATNVLGPKQARLVLTWSPCLHSGACARANLVHGGKRKLQTTIHKPQTTYLKPQTTNHKPQQ